MKKEKKAIIILIVVLIIVFIPLILEQIFKTNSKNSNQIENQTNDIIVENLLPDNETPEDIENIELSDENKIKSTLVLEEFSDGKKLDTDQYLKVVYNAIDNKYVDFNKENDVYSKNDINSIIYKIFGVTITEFKTIDGLELNEDGTYTYKKSNNSENEITIIENLESDVAAGTAYFNFELYVKKNNEKKFIGNYISEMGQNTENDEKYIKSIRLVD